VLDRSTTDPCTELISAKFLRRGYANEGENVRPVRWVVVEEVKSGNWGIGGNPLTTSDAQALVAGK
jgi:hypothetical protein